MAPFFCAVAQCAQDKEFVARRILHKNAREFSAWNVELAVELNHVWRRGKFPDRLCDQTDGLKALIREYETFFKE